MTFQDKGMEAVPEPCPECGKLMRAQKSAPWFQACMACLKGWNVNYSPPQIYWEATKKERERMKHAP